MTTMRRRSGFTLVELMVAMALIMFIMAILSEAFTEGMKSFRHLKATADMAERLRAVSNILHKELGADHFDAKRRMSGADEWNNGPATEGFVRVYHGSPRTLEGADVTEVGLGTPFLNSYRTTDHMLHFTAKLRGNERGDFFSTGSLPAGSLLTTSPLLLGPRHYQEGANPNVYNSQWAEIAYFLRPTGDNAKGTPLYSLYRRQLLLVPDNGLLTGNVAKGANVPATATAQYEYPEMSASYNGANVYFNNPRDVTMPVRRFGMTAGNLAGAYASTYTDPTTNVVRNTYPTMAEDTGPYPRPDGLNFQGADLMLTDVISFEVLVLPSITQTGGAHFVDLFDQTLNFDVNNVAQSNNNSVYPAGAGTAGPRIYDTWSNMIEKPQAGGAPVNNYSAYTTAGAPQSIPFKTSLRIRAIAVTIRVWDLKTEQTRQITIVQDM
jgi:prepilin-type N-terminal cleavage/methylation domain-containing protein